MTKEQTRQRAFEFFTEIGIINQLAVSMFNRRLPDGLHVSHFSVLNHLIRLGDGKTPLSIANAFQVTKGTMTNTLSGLSRRGLVRIEPNAEDGRSKLVFITEAGRVFHKQAIDSLGPAVAMLEGNIDFERLSEILPVLSDIRQILDENRDI